jgi:hypothetical protein
VGQLEIKGVLPFEGDGGELSAEQIAARLGENVGTVRVLLTRIRNKPNDDEVVTHEKIIDGVSIYHYARRR